MCSAPHYNHPIQNLLRDAASTNAADKYFSASNSDLYHVTTGQALQSMNGWKATMNLTMRGDLDSTYFVMGGLKYLIPALSEFRFDKDFIQWAKSLKRPDGVTRYNPDYLDTLQGQPFDVKLDMAPDGSVLFPGPVGRVTGNPTQNKWIDGMISQFTRLTNPVATKTSRLLWVADKYGMKLADNALRRPADLSGMMTAEVTTALGLAGTSHMRASMRNEVQPVGTMDHAYVQEKMAEWFWLNPHADTKKLDNQRLAQQHAFRDFMKEHPEHGMLLVDLMSTEIGVEDAIIVLQEFNPQNYSLRIDSGTDLHASHQWTSKRLAEEGLSRINVSLTGDMRAVSLDALGKKGIREMPSGIGGYFQNKGELARSSNDLYEPPITNDMVGKEGALVAPDGQVFDTMKIGDGNRIKSSRPGVLERVRFVSPGGMLMGDVEVDLLRTPLSGKALTETLRSLRVDTLKEKTFLAGTPFILPIEQMLDGPEIINHNHFDDKHMRARYEQQFAMLDPALKEVDGTHAKAPIGIEAGLYSNWEPRTRNLQIVERR